MNMNGINGNTKTGSQSFRMKIDHGNDVISKNIQDQISNAQKQLQELSEDTEMPPEDKMKKRQELQKRINDLNNQLRQHQIEQKKEARQKKEHSDMAGGKQTERSDKGSAGMSTANMQALISADSSMREVKVQGAVRTEMKDKTGILETEIKLDKARGVDTTAKEEELAETEQRVQNIAASQASSLSEVSDKLREASKEDTGVHGTDRDDSEDKDEEKVNQSAENNTQIPLSNSNYDLKHPHINERITEKNNTTSVTDRAMTVDVKA